MKKNLFVFSICLFILSACRAVTSPTPVPTAFPTATIVPTDTPSPTPSPFVVEVTDIPTPPTALPKIDATIPIALLGKNATQQEIAKALFTQWLERAKTTGSLDDYEVIEVNATSLAGRDYGVDFVATVTYSVRPSKTSNRVWDAGNGRVVKGDPWIRNKFYFIGVRRDNDVYVLDILGTGL